MSDAAYVPPAAERRPRLQRARQGRWIAGVCLGVARRFGWPVGPVRVLWLVVAAIPVLPGLPLYLLAWLLVPAEPPLPMAGVTVEEP